jgi:DNA polymerase-3 subunit alpha
MGKKKVEKLAEEYPRYMKAASQHMDTSTAQTIWEDLVGFAKYGFNKSHAVEYGIILLWTMYAKYYYPREFILASINTVAKDKKSRYVQEAQRMGMEISLPQLGIAQPDSILTENGIMFGWADINGIGQQPAKWITKNCWTGMTFDEFEELRTSDAGKIVIGNGTKRVAVDIGAVEKLKVLGTFADLPMTEDKHERMEIEESLLGIALSDTSAIILDEYKDLIDQFCVPYQSMVEPGEYAIAGVIQEIQSRKTKKGLPYASIKIMDDVDETEFFVWDKELRRLDFIFRYRTAGIFRVKKNDRGMSLIDAQILLTKESGDTIYERERV